jgi:N-acetylglutamate synthase-like GNAT family acetyltransferase
MDHPNHHVTDVTCSPPAHVSRSEREGGFVGRTNLQSMRTEIKYLADHPELTHLLAAWFHDEWGKNNPSLTTEIIERRMRERLNRDKIPLCMVALTKSKPIATATLKIREMEIYSQFEYWLGNVYVLPEYRNQGVGSQIVEATVDKAKSLDVKDLYLYTRDQKHFYQRLGWIILERVEYHAHMVVVMRRPLQSAA